MANSFIFSPILRIVFIIISVFFYFSLALCWWPTSDLYVDVGYYTGCYSISMKSIFNRWLKNTHTWFKDDQLQCSRKFKDHRSDNRAKTFMVTILIPYWSTFKCVTSGEYDFYYPVVSSIKLWLDQLVRRLISAALKRDVLNHSVKAYFISQNITVRIKCVSV